MEYRGWIYCIKNKVNNKKYIGQTIDYDKRKAQHFYSVESEGCPLLKAAYSKYGIENFEMFPIVTFEAVSRKVLHEVLDELERFYIQKFDTYGKGYNATKGGNGMSGFSFSKETRQSWSNKRKGKTNKSTYLIPVDQYDLDGNFIKRYNTIFEASQQFTNNTQCDRWILRAASDKNRQAFGFMWRLCIDSKPKLKIKRYIKGYFKPLYLYTKDGILIASYTDIKIASRETGVKEKTIRNSMEQCKKDKIRKSNYWSREAPNESN